AHVEGALNEVEDVVAAGVGVGQQELGDGAGVAGQELAVGAPGQAVVGRLDDLLGRPPLLVGGGGPADADQAGDLGDLEAAATVEQEVAEQAVGVVVVPLPAAEAEGALEQTQLLRGEAWLGEVRLCEPCSEAVRRGRHGTPSRAKLRGVVYSVA